MAVLLRVAFVCAVRADEVVPHIGRASMGPIFSKPHDFPDSIRNPISEGIRPVENGAGSSELRFVSLSESCSNVCFWPRG